MYNQNRKPVHKIKLIKANLKRDLRSLSQMIPYVVVEIGGLTKKSMVDAKGGKRPVWNQVLEFQTNQNTAKFSIYDSGNFSDSLIAQGHFNLMSLPDSQNQAQVKLTFQGSPAGILYIKITSKLIKLNIQNQLNKYSETSQDQSQKMRFQGVASKLIFTPQKSTKYNPFQQISSKMCMEQNQAKIINHVQPTAFASPVYPNAMSSPIPQSQNVYPQMNMASVPYSPMVPQIQPNNYYLNTYPYNCGVNQPYYPNYRNSNAVQNPNIPYQMVMQNYNTNNNLQRYNSSMVQNNSSLSYQKKKNVHMENKNSIQGFVDSISSLF